MSSKNPLIVPVEAARDLGDPFSKAKMIPQNAVRRKWLFLAQQGRIPVDLAGGATKKQGQCGAIDLLSSLKQRRGAEVMEMAFNNNMLYLLQNIIGTNKS